MKIKYIFNIKVLSTLNRLTWNLRGLGRTWGASGSTANFSNLQNTREWWGQVRRGAAVQQYLFFSLEAVSSAHPFSSTRLM